MAHQNWYIKKEFKVKQYAILGDIFTAVIGVVEQPNNENIVKTNHKNRCVYGIGKADKMAVVVN